MSVNAICRTIDLGLVELNDLVSSDSYSALAEMQNFVFRDSRSQIYSFAYSQGGAGWAAPVSSSAFAIFEADIPEGIDQIEITSRGETVKLDFFDITAGVPIATQSHTSPANQIFDYYAIPAAGVRKFLIEISNGGTLDLIIIQWNAQTIP